MARPYVVLSLLSAFLLLSALAVMQEEDAEEITQPGAFSNRILIYTPARPYMPRPPARPYAAPAPPLPPLPPRSYYSNASAKTSSLLRPGPFHAAAAAIIALAI